MPDVREVIVRNLPPALRPVGTCIVCHAPVLFSGKTWKEPGQRRGRHSCPVERAVCGARMPRYGELCQRRPGHLTEHRSAYALANARYMKSGRAA